MRTCVLLLVLLAGCFPDADKLRTKGGPVNPGVGGSVPIGGSVGGGGGGGVGGAIGGAGGGVGGMGGGTGGVTGTGGMTSAARMQLCNELALASSAKSHECAPFIQAFRYGSQEAHAARIRLNCSLYDLPSVRFPPSPFKPCGDALAAQPCSDWLDNVPLPACVSSGSLAVGATCATGNQCQSDLCDIPATGCGRCVALPGAGQACYKGYCAAGLVCTMAGKCLAPGKMGAACDANTPCAESLGCHAGVCSPRGAPGAPCATNDECDVYHGSICLQAGVNVPACPAAGGVCVAVTTGSACTINADCSYVFCSAGATCKMGTCLAAAGDGASCDATNGPDCVWPAECLSDGKCHLFQANQTCLGKAAARPTGPELDLPRGEAGAAAFWRSLVPRPPKNNF